MPPSKSSSKSSSKTKAASKKAPTKKAAAKKTPAKKAAPKKAGKRRARQVKEQPIFLAIVDESAEQQAAIEFAALRAKKTKGNVALLSVAETQNIAFSLGVENLMREEALEKAEVYLNKVAEDVEAITGITPLICLREGDVGEEAVNLIESDTNISAVVVSAKSDNSRSVRLVTKITSKYIDEMHIPITVIPGELTKEEVAKLA